MLCTLASCLTISQSQGQCCESDKLKGGKQSGGRLSTSLKPNTVPIGGVKMGAAALFKAITYMSWIANFSTSFRLNTFQKNPYSRTGNMGMSEPQECDAEIMRNLLYEGCSNLISLTEIACTPTSIELQRQGNTGQLEALVASSKQLYGSTARRPLNQLWAIRQGTSACNWVFTASCKVLSKQKEEEE
ncbi:unnamed protein product [Ilex paraguariensis]|uniref:Uncharacterized protein n=1 Tax=Ilex paraguariensis TaxID=185542 RepID=A0ABC8TDD0_9AQUA